MSAACEFLSHPAEGDRGAIPLHEHLSKVARSAREIAEHMSPGAGEDAFVAGLLHDVGKLSPWYQGLFAGEDESVLRSKYGKRQHAPFSAWAARHLLFGKKGEHYVVHSVAGHHGGIRTRLHAPNDPRSKAAQQVMLSNLQKFRDHVCSGSGPESEAWCGMDWDGCMDAFGCSVNFSERIKANGGGGIGSYLRAKCIFSALLQADRGSFHNLPRPALSMKIQPTHAGSPTTEVGRLRQAFQDAAFASYLQNADERVVVIEAPTGMGKTDLIFRILGHHSEQKTHERAFYFSPLLALNDGFVSSLTGGSSTRPAVPKESDRDGVLEYNHMTAEPISNRDGGGGDWIESISDREQKSATLYSVASFNYPFVVSTTARLLLTIYGTQASNCIKFASLSRSIIIVDEIQTVPKLLLKSLVGVLSWIAKSSGSKVILVSATIPVEITGMGVCEIRCNANASEEFAGLTPKTLSVSGLLEPKAVAAAAPASTAVMFNTRSAAREFYCGQDSLRGSFGEVMYLTSGIRKQDRLSHIRRIARGDLPGGILVISTQVLEAGVDASFERMFREMAPLDSIVQAMGRLNRHGGAEAAEIIVFDRNLPRPYRDVEIDETQKVLGRLAANGPVSSTAVYAGLREYYEAVSTADERSRKEGEDLERRMEDNNYDGTWEIVHNAAFESYNINVLLPYPNGTPGVKQREQFDSLHDEVVDMVESGRAGSLRNVMRRAARLSADLPESSLGQVREMLDPRLLEHGICIPRDNEALGKIYDSQIGLDKWVRGRGSSC